MPRSPTVYSLPPGTTPQIPNTVIPSAMFNAAMDDIASTFNTAQPVAYGGTGATTVIGGWDALNARGTDVATASSVNLTTATGPNLHMTGTTTVSTITLAAGAVRFVIADGAFQLTASANLIVNGSTSVNATTAAGNLLIFIGDSGSVARVWIIGTAVGYLPLTGGTMTGQLINTASSVGYTPFKAVSTEAAAAAGPIVELYRDSASPAANDILGQVLFNGEDSAGNTQEYGSIQSVIVSPTAASEASTLDFYTQKGGARTLSASLAGPVASFTNAAQGYTTTATAAGTTTLTVSSTQQQYFTGTSTQTVVLPVTSTLTFGHSYRIVNNSTGGAVTVQSSGANSIIVIPQGSTALLTCILTSGTTAASWDAKSAPNGGLVLLTSGTVSAAANLSVPLTSYTAYAGFQFELIGFIPATDNVALYIRTSTNGGSSYDSGASDYRFYSAQLLDNNNTVFGDSRSVAAAQISACVGVGNGSAEGVDASIKLMGNFNTALQAKLRFECDVYDQANNAVGYRGGGRRAAAADVDAIQFLFSSGNIASGTYRIYGYI